MSATRLFNDSLLGPNPTESDLAVPGMSISVKHPDDASACGSWKTLVEKQVDKRLLNK